VEELMRRSQSELASYGSEKFDNFYAAFSGATILETAVKEGTVPFHSKKSLNTYFKKVYAKRPATPEPPRPLPYPYNLLVKLQSKDGRWTNVDKVLALLDLPRSVLLEGLDGWENATVFALAAIRQRPDLAEDLMDAHDRAFQWMESRGLVYRALERIYSAAAPSPSSPSHEEQSKTEPTDLDEHAAHMTASPITQGGAPISVPQPPVAPAPGPAARASSSGENHISREGEGQRAGQEGAGEEKEASTPPAAASPSSSFSLPAATVASKAPGIFIPGDPTAQADYDKLARDLKELEV
jgi:hypothetical protein